MDDGEIRCWRLDTSAQTLVLASHDGRLVECVYWGGTLAGDEDLAALAQAGAPDLPGGTLDSHPPLSICPEADRSFPGQPGLVLRDDTGAPLTPRLRLTSFEQDIDALTLHHADNGLGVRYTARIGADPATGMLTLSASLESDRPVHLDWLSVPVLPAPQHSDRMIDFAGRWIGEFKPVQLPWNPGIRMRESRTGRTGHEHFPGLILTAPGTTNMAGEAVGFHYGWSGGHRMVAEELPDGRRQIQFGHAVGTRRGPATRFTTAELFAVRSTTGLNGVATAFQRHLRERIVTWPHPDRARPVHYNCWEAVYFDHDLDRLRDIATRAADLGAERFVLDDGWFGRRDNDHSSLGDWDIDARKYPEGLGPLIDHVQALGMSFGIWFEPEMVNVDSDLFRAHPDWALGPEDQIEGRHQRVLDIANPAVRDYLYDKIGAVLSNHAIDYIKWDHNRVLPRPDAAQTDGLYDLLSRLRADFPAVEIESCASGGGRIDFGILRHTQRVWLSDSNDALERLRIQHNAALFLPAAVTGSHVGPRHCHTSGRVLDIRFRAWVAAQRHMGFEMDPNELTEAEAEVLRDVTSWWKANRDWMRAADILRLDSSDPALIAEQQMSRDGGRFVVFAGVADTSVQSVPRPLRLGALEPGARYRITLANRAEATRLSLGKPALKTETLTLAGRYLMDHGLTLPWAFPLSMWVVEGARI